ncbi:hypothetical protein X471_00599 [Bartonella bacilliformis str. Heidi Mejia]|uniref:Thiol:disulfide interchange protein DsbD N-terminal domain-containing protein n=2 Tax=Bartonella bacilliformis TaxID=774 RepID=A1URX5_BARBK|nr:protein-disulfide reductase DsbD domain-containing protein [Bartonella bacilliformis]ABM45577.1 conserved hypothetical protein [Bartonella bacilliformis KC583]AMG85568.1 hypothetical protein AL467_02005 [Bartonella bacilliformis]EKS44980.1 hypothetical protein BbINS_01909 [Bartonella bacilliformis INS]EYS90137.1 hypothetical protein X472_00593 [Bartonella bacilliformis San Pedro600-02]EYS92301.1 hypothetical protein X471_00599 [Bartonella bacilliformis str. Heidi Mejia]
MRKIQIFLNLQKMLMISHKKLSVIFSLTFMVLGLINPTFSTQTEQETHLISTPWHESSGGRIRLAITKVSLHGMRDGIIEVVLKPEWKTYWRNPGNSGMAPFFNFDQQVAYEIFYPTPQLYEKENDWSLGYKNKVVLPFRIFGSHKHLSGSLTIGICNKICMPFTVDFNFSPFFPKNEHLSSSLLLKNAQASLPRIKHNALTISAEKKENALLITIHKNRKITPESLFLDGGDMQIGPAKKISDHQDYTFFSAPIYFIPDEPNQTVFYIISAKDHALSGTFTINKQDYSDISIDQERLSIP